MQRKRLNSQGIDPRSYKVSVFTAAYNSGDLLYRGFHSLRAQTWRNWEWIIYDDSDLKDKGNTWETLKKLKDLDQRVKIIKGKRHSGLIGFTKGQACSRAAGRLLAELDHDDEIAPTCLETIVKAFKSYPDAVFAYTICSEPFEESNKFVQYIDGWGQGMGSHYYQLIDDRWMLVANNPDIRPESLSSIVGCPNHMRVWDAKTYWKVGGHDPGLKHTDDYDLMLRTFLAGKFIKIPQPLYYQYYRHSANTTDVGDNRKEINATWPIFYEKHNAGIADKFKEYGIDREPENIPYWQHSDHYPAVNYLYQPNKDLISIPLPTFNRPDSLRKAIDSVFQQTYENWELLIVGDNCSHLEGVMEEFKDPRIKWWNLSSNYGAGGATPRNYALKMLSVGNYIAYIDDDMKWKPNHLSSLLEALKSTKADYAISSMDWGPWGPLVCREPKLYRVDTSSVLHKKLLLEKYGYWKSREEASYAHDWELVSRWEEHPYAATLKDSLIYNMNVPYDFNDLYNKYGDQNG